MLLAAATVAAAAAASDMLRAAVETGLRVWSSGGNASLSAAAGVQPLLLPRGVEEKQLCRLGAVADSLAGH